MNKIAEWFKNLEAEFIILFICFVILFILTMIVINAIRKIKKTITFDGFKLTEDLLLIGETYHTRIRITNISFSTGIIKEIGFMEKKTRLPRLTDQITIEERDHYNIDLELSELRKMMTLKKKIKMYVYVIDGLNYTEKKKLKISNKKINYTIKLEKRNLKLEKKKERFKTGNYNFFERINLILILIFSPLVKLSRFIKKKTNQGLYKRQLKKQAKLERKKLEEASKKEFEIEHKTENELDEIENIEIELHDEEVDLEEINTDESSEETVESELED